MQHSSPGVEAYQVPVTGFTLKTDLREASKFRMWLTINDVIYEEVGSSTGDTYFIIRQFDQKTVVTHGDWIIVDTKSQAVTVLDNDSFNFSYKQGRA